MPTSHNPLLVPQQSGMAAQAQPDQTQAVSGGQNLPLLNQLTVDAQTQAPVMSAEQTTANDEALLKQATAQTQQIIESTKDDPFLQAQEYEKLKASYMYTRFGRVIKVSEK